MNTKNLQKRAEVIELRKSGLSFKQIAQQMGYKNANPSYVRKICQENGLDMTIAQKHEAMREYKAQGHSHKEVAEHFGVNEQTSVNICKGIAPQKDRKPKQYSNGWNHEKQEANAIRIIEERAPSFEYVGGYTKTEGFVYIRCKTCGAVLHKSFVSIRHGRATCENCKRIASEAREQQKERERQIEAEKKAWQRISEVKSKQLSFSVCECCGCLFFSEKDRKFCSKECAEKTWNSIKKDKRIKKLKSIVVDKNITLERLYKESNGVCAICGGQCDWSDHVIKDGIFVVGAMYPSIDHVKPISKGGLHEWSNVQLAHLSCNSKKGNNE